MLDESSTKARLERIRGLSFDDIYALAPELLRSFNKEPSGDGRERMRTLFVQLCDEYTRREEEQRRVEQLLKRRLQTLYDQFQDEFTRRAEEQRTVVILAWINEVSRIFDHELSEEEQLKMLRLYHELHDKRTRREEEEKNAANMQN